MGNHLGGFVSQVLPGKNGHGVYDPRRDALPIPEDQYHKCRDELTRAREQDPWLMRDLRSDHAGEVGAVWIYKGAMAAMRVRPHGEHLAAFVEHHLEAERGHLAFFQQALEDKEHTALVPMWKVMGFCLGFFPTLISAGALFVTVHAVETFVEDHYNSHILPLEGRSQNPYPALTSALKQFCADEVQHARDAALRYGTRVLHDDLSKPGMAATWSRIVQWGSATAANMARKF